jgi:hypothetical protein
MSIQSTRSAIQTMDSKRTGATSILGEWQSWIVLILAAIAVLPSILLASLYFVAFRVVFQFGHWPYLGNPDASAMSEDLQPGTGLLALLVPLAVYVASAALFAALVLRHSRRLWRVPFSLLASVLTWMFLLGLLICDPAGVWQWIMD